MRGAQSFLLRFGNHTSLICESRKISIAGELEAESKIQREGKPLDRRSETIPLSMKDRFRGKHLPLSST
jgi:hypothetical protein